eukprot:4357481-Amphidinium_carterae.1
MALPVCAQVTGISGMDWATMFMDVRATLKVEAAPGMHFFPVLVGGKTTAAAITVQEATTQIRRL